MTPHDSFIQADTSPLNKSKHSVRNALLAAVALAGAAGGIWFYAGSGGGAGGAGSGGGGSTGKGRPSTTVGVAKVLRADMPVAITAIGTVQPIINATVRTQLAGTLFSINFTEGQMVHKGQVLAQIDPRPYQLTLQQAQGNLARDMATLNSARVDLRRYQTLLAQDSIARQQVDTQMATVRQLEGTIAADKAAIGTAKLNLGYTTIRAPVRGKLGLRLSDIGSFITPSDANGIVGITQVDPVDVSFALPQSQLAQVSQAAHGHALPVTIFDQGNTIALAHGQFRTFDNAVDPTSGTIKAKARVTNGDATLVPNQFVNVSVLVNTLQQALTVPVTAVRVGPSGPFVYTMSPDKTAHRVAVTTGPSDGMKTAILSGLKGDETIIFEGADKIDDGSKVRTADGHGGHGGQGGGQGGAPGGSSAQGSDPSQHHHNHSGQNGGQAQQAPQQ